MLAQNARLRVLDLGCNPIGQPGLKAIADAMRSNTTPEKAIFTLPTEASEDMRLQGSVIEVQAANNKRVDRMLSEQKAWQASAGWSCLPIDLTSLLEQGLIRADIKLHDSTDEATRRHLLEVQL